MTEKKRIERDSFGEIEVAAEAYWGAQTERSLHFFNIGNDKVPFSIIHVFGMLKKTAAQVNVELNLLSKERAEWIIQAATEVLEGKLDRHFPLSIYQTGSGTQTNMNVNEVIANRATELSSGKISPKIHPNDEVNCSQSTNDTFPTVMHVAAVLEINSKLLPAMRELLRVLNQKSKEYSKIIKMGRTHLMDAVPITLGQEFSAYAEQIEQNIERVEQALPRLFELAIGGTAVGTGLLAPKEFGEKVAAKMAAMTKLPFKAAKNRFAALSSHDPLLFMSGAFATFAASLIKIATDLSWMGSGPRCGLNELFLPENEPGSSIMPGKINPTQCEAIQMVAVQVMGYHTAIEIAASRGNFELNVMKPLIIDNLLRSITLLTDGIFSFTNHFILKIEPNLKQMEHYLERSLMLVTALREKIGYDKAAKIALKAYHENNTLKEAAIALGFLTEKEFDELVVPQKMV